MLRENMTAAELAAVLRGIETELCGGVLAFTDRAFFLPNVDAGHVAVIGGLLERTGRHLLDAKEAVSELTTLLDDSEGAIIVFEPKNFASLDKKQIQNQLSQTVQALDQLLKADGIADLTKHSVAAYAANGPVRGAALPLGYVGALASAMLVSLTRARRACVDTLRALPNYVQVADDEPKATPTSTTTTPTTFNTLAEVVGAFDCGPAVTQPGIDGARACMRSFHDAIHFDAIAFINTLDASQQANFAVLLERLACVYINLKKHVTV